MQIDQSFEQNFQTVEILLKKSNILRYTSVSNLFEILIGGYNCLEEFFPLWILVWKFDYFLLIANL